MSFRSELGNYHGRDFEGSLQFPITDETLWARFSARSTTRDGTFENACAGAPANPRVRTIDEAPPGPSYCGETVSRSTASYVEPNQPKNLNSRNNWAARAVFLFQPNLRGDVDMDWLFTVRGGRLDVPSTVGQSIGTNGEQRFIDTSLSGPALSDRSNDLMPSIAGTLGGSDQSGFIDPDIAKAFNRTLDDLEAQCAPSCSVGQDFSRPFEARRIVAKDLARNLDANPRIGRYNHTGRTTNDTWGASLKGTIEIGDRVELTSVTGFDTYDRRVDVDLDFTPNTNFENVTEDDGFQVFQEIRLNGQAFDGLDEFYGGPLDWEVGTFVFGEDLDAETITNTGPATAAGIINAADQIKGISNQKVVSIGAYASAGWDFWDAFTLDGGIRFNYERRTIDYTLFFRGVPGVAQKRRMVGTEPTGTIRLTWRPNQESSLYAKFTHGWKSGTFNATGSGALGVVDTDPEKVDAFEIGLHGSYFENRLSLTLSVFHYAYQDYQLFTSRSLPRSSPQFVILNASDVELYGSEVEATILPWAGGVIDIKFAWLEGEFLKFVQTATRLRVIPNTALTTFYPVENVLSGNRLLNAPRYTLTLSLQQALPIGRFGTLVARWDGSWKDENHFDATEGQGQRNGEGDLFLPPGTIGQAQYWIHNVRLAYLTPDERIEIAGWVRNVANETFKAFSFDLSNFQKTTLYFVGDPRTYGISTSFRF